MDVESVLIWLKEKISLHTLISIFMGFIEILFLIKANLTEYIQTENQSHPLEESPETQYLVMWVVDARLDQGRQYGAL